MRIMRAVSTSAMPKGMSGFGLKMESSLSRNEEVKEQDSTKL